MRTKLIRNEPGHVQVIFFNTLYDFWFDNGDSLAAVDVDGQEVYDDHWDDAEVVWEFVSEEHPEVLI